MVDPPMVRVATASGPFEAKLLAARLGADGIVWELRGGADGIYPMGPIDVLVAADDADVARVLLAPEERDEPDPAPVDGPVQHRGPRLRPLLLVAVVVLSLTFVVVRTFAL